MSDSISRQPESETPETPFRPMRSLLFCVACVAGAFLVVVSAIWAWFAVPKFVIEPLFLLDGAYSNEVSAVITAIGWTALCFGVKAFLSNDHKGRDDRTATLVPIVAFSIAGLAAVVWLLGKALSGCWACHEADGSIVDMAVYAFQLTPWFGYVVLYFAIFFAIIMADE